MSGFIGRTGVGKGKLLQMIAGPEHPAAGRVATPLVRLFARADGGAQ